MKKITLTNQQYERFITYVVDLIYERQLPSESNDHPLTANYEGYREFHIGGDAVVVYNIIDNVLNLVRIGSHNQVFK